MSKYLKNLIIASLIVCMTVCIGIFAAACNNDPNSGNGGNEFTYPSSINVTVLLDDGTPAVGVSVQLCTVSDDGTADSANCKLPKATNAQGVSTTNIQESDGYKFEAHILNIPETYKAFSYVYVDANGKPYAEGTGARIDVRESANVTVKLAVVDANKLSAGGNDVELEAITDTYTAKANIENAGWYRISSSENPFLLSGVGFALTDARSQVSAYLKPNSVLTFTFTDENALSFQVGLLAINADGTEDKPLPADLESAYVISLEANKTVYITNNTNNSRPMPIALDVSGTNFKANYEGTDNTEAFTLKAPAYEEETFIPQTFTVGTADGATGVVTLYFGEHITGGGDTDYPAITLNESITISGADFFSPVTYTLIVAEDGNYKFDTEISLAGDVVINTTLEDGAAGLDGAIEDNNGVYALTAGTYYVSFYNNGAVTVSKN